MPETDTIFVTCNTRETLPLHLHGSLCQEAWSKHVPIYDIMRRNPLELHVRECVPERVWKGCWVFPLNTCRIWNDEKGTNTRVWDHGTESTVPWTVSFLSEEMIPFPPTSSVPFSGQWTPSVFATPWSLKSPIILGRQRDSFPWVTNKRSTLLRSRESPTNGTLSLVIESIFGWAWPIFSSNWAEKPLYSVIGPSQVSGSIYIRSIFGQLQSLTTNFQPLAVAEGDTRAEVEGEGGLFRRSSLEVGRQMTWFPIPVALASKQEWNNGTEDAIQQANSQARMNELRETWRHRETESKGE